MNTASVLALAAGGALGALSRFGIGEFIRIRSRWPGWAAVFIANVLGTALLAVMHFALGDSRTLSPEVQSFVVLGYCGALTTYSAFGLDTVLLWYEGRRGIAVGQFVATLLCGAVLIQWVARAAQVAP